MELNSKPARLPGSCPPKFLPGVRRLQMTILPAREPWPIESKAPTHQFGGKVPSVRQETFGDDPVIGKLGADYRADYPASAKLDQDGFRALSPGMIQFRSVNAGQPNTSPINFDRIAVNNPAHASEYYRHRRAPGPFDHHQGGLAPPPTIATAAATQQSPQQPEQPHIGPPPKWV